MRNQTGGKRMSGRTGSAGAKFLLRLLLGWFALASGLVWSAAADAQLLPYRNDIAPDRQVIDSRGVDVNLGEINVSTEPVGVGDLSSAASWSGITDFSKFRAYVTGGTSGELYVFLHGKTIKFLLSGGAYVPGKGDGYSLVKSALEQYTYTSPDGAVYYFQRVHADNQKMIGAMHIRAYLMTVAARWTQARLLLQGSRKRRGLRAHLFLLVYDSRAGDRQQRWLYAQGKLRVTGLWDEFPDVEERAGDQPERRLLRPQRRYLHRTDAGLADANFFDIGQRHHDNKNHHRTGRQRS